MTARADDAPVSVTARNRVFYDELYRPRGPLAHALRARISFDQQAKTRPNLDLLADVLADAAAAGTPLRVLDYGCGWGTLLLSLPRARVAAFGYDLAPAAVENLAATMRFFRRAFTPARLDASGELPEAAFDVIVCSHVLEHVEDDAALLRTLAAALRVGGHLLVNVPVHEVVVDPKHARAYDRASLEAALVRAGLDVLDLVERDRLSAVFLIHEEHAPAAVRLAFRAARGVLALAPAVLTRAIDAVVPARYPRQQLLALAVKPA